MQRPARGPRPRRAATALAAASLIALVGCSDEDPPTVSTPEAVESEAADGIAGDAEEAEAEADAEPELTAEELLAAPANHQGEQVDVEAVIRLVLVDGAFLLAPPGTEVTPEPSPALPQVASENEFVVIGPTEDVAAGDTVRVTGTVRDGLVDTDLEDRVPESWPDGALDDFVDGPWLEATSVEPVGG
ncbi:hypothetical protein [Quadrisphaera sp. DSM 44207]|uniref:hypothetical protein n=1 Tax=Quadrisphaera sp. DSM 44207 TaxID=1881057 RepID=UPI0008822B59|nr:hypothetical protein [Quadrisphaera sp. DSM 44207]SDQ04178.1 hypothetical protein SAMN05428996_0086 [Quadrisphaera sp. DSM 44207]